MTVEEEYAKWDAIEHQAREDALNAGLMGEGDAVNEVNAFFTIGGGFKDMFVSPMRHRT